MSVSRNFQSFKQWRHNLNILNIQYLLADLITLDPGPLLQSGQHHDGGAPLLPDQAPEVSQGLRQRTLQQENNQIFKKRILKMFMVGQLLASFHT